MAPILPEMWWTESYRKSAVIIEKLPSSDQDTVRMLPYMDKTTSEELENMVECTWEGWGPQSSWVYKTCCAWQKWITIIWLLTQIWKQNHSTWYSHGICWWHNIFTDQVSKAHSNYCNISKLIIFKPMNDWKHQLIHNTCVLFIQDTILDQPCQPEFIS